MVKLAVAGASGGLASEVIDALAKTGKHEILALMRKDPAGQRILPGVTWVQTQFDNKDELVRLLRGVNTALCFFTASKDPGCRCQKLLIDAAVEAGVPRYVPAEWSMGAALDKYVNLTSYQDKLIARDYLAQLNKDRKVLEYTLIWPGIFTNYLGYPHKTAEHVTLFPVAADLGDSGTVTVIEGYEDARVAFTTLADISATVAAIIDYDGPWPVHGGFRGDSISFSELVRVAERATGRKLEVEVLKPSDLEAGRLLRKEPPKVVHPSIPPEAMATVWPTIVCKFLLAMAYGGWDTSDEWNKLLPDLKFTSVEEFLTPLFAKKE